MVTFVYSKNNDVVFLENFNYYKKGIGFDIPIISLKTRYDALKYLSQYKVKSVNKMNTIPYCNLEFLENIFKLNISKEIYQLESFAFIKAILTNKTNCLVDYYQYVKEIELSCFEEWLDVADNKSLYKTISFKMFNNDQIREFIKSSKKDSYYHEEVSSFCVFDYYCNNIRTDLMPLFCEYFQKYEQGFRKHFVVNKSEFDSKIFKEFFSSLIQNSNEEISNCLDRIDSYSLKDKKNKVGNEEKQANEAEQHTIVEKQANEEQHTNEEETTEEKDDTEDMCIDESGLCCICFENKANVCYDKCNHVSVCVECLYNTSKEKYTNSNILDKWAFPKCPLCRDLNHSVKIVYLN